jgi:hypothetical protein
MKQMAANGRAITIVRVDEYNGYTKADSHADARNGQGTDSTIGWNPNLDYVPGFEDQGSTGSEIPLAHEMVHALHNANGDNRNGPRDYFPWEKGTASRNEERSTVGTGGRVLTPDDTCVNDPDYSKDVPTENSFRDDLGVPRRPSYFPPDVTRKVPRGEARRPEGPAGRPPGADRMARLPQLDR